MDVPAFFVPAMFDSFAHIKKAAPPEVERLF